MLRVCFSGFMATLIAHATLATYVTAADPPPSKTPNADEAATSDPEGLRIHLMDGSQLSGKLTADVIEVETPFGKLAIPVKSIRSFTPGLRSHPKVEQNISALIERLGSPVFNERESAQKSLVDMGPQIRAQLEAVANDADTERRARVKAILEEFDQVEADRDDEEQAAATLIEGDAIETTEFTVVGKIVQQEFEIHSRYGPLKVQLSDIRRVDRPTSESSEVAKNVTVDDSHIVQRSMKDTGVRIERGDKITITAEGTLQMTPWGNQSTSGPDGGSNYGMLMPNRIQGGTLIGKIGRNGPIFRIGSKSSFTADRSGILQLAIAMQSDYANQQFPGEYKAKVRVRKK